jgi:hypothetical protein
MSQHTKVAENVSATRRTPLISKDRRRPCQTLLEGVRKEFGWNQFQVLQRARLRASVISVFDQGTGAATRRQTLARFFLILYSAFATRIRSSSSLMGIQDVKTFIAFSKSESSRISRVASISAADVACNTSRSPLKLDVGELE